MVGVVFVSEAVGEGLAVVVVVVVVVTVFVVCMVVVRVGIGGVVVDVFVIVGGVGH